MDRYAGGEFFIGLPKFETPAYGLKSHPRRTMWDKGHKQVIRLLSIANDYGMVF